MHVKTKSNGAKHSIDSPSDALMLFSSDLLWSKVIELHDCNIEHRGVLQPVVAFSYTQLGR